MRWDEFREPVAVAIVLYRKNMYNYIRYNIRIELHKTRR